MQFCASKQDMSAQIHMISKTAATGQMWLRSLVQCAVNTLRIVL